MRIRSYLLLASCLLGLAAIVLTLALVGTPEVSGWAVTAARAALGSSAVGLMLVGAAVLFLGSLAARTWAIAEDVARRPGPHDEPSLIDDSPAPLPDEWHRGEVVEFRKKQPQSAA